VNLGAEEVEALGGAGSCILFTPRRLAEVGVLIDDLARKMDGFLELFARRVPSSLYL
jgi:hypothetical protein